MRSEKPLMMCQHDCDIQECKVQKIHDTPVCRPDVVMSSDRYPARGGSSNDDPSTNDSALTLASLSDIRSSHHSEELENVLNNQKLTSSSKVKWSSGRAYQNLDSHATTTHNAGKTGKERVDLIGEGGRDTLPLQVTAVPYPRSRSPRARATPQQGGATGTPCETYQNVPAASIVRREGGGPWWGGGDHEAMTFGECTPTSTATATAAVTAALPLPDLITFNTPVADTPKPSTRSFLEKTGFYYGDISAVQAKETLRTCEVGTFLLRNSSDPLSAASLSVKTPRGTTAIRIVCAKGLYRLDCDPGSVHKMPVFQCIVQLVEHYVSQSAGDARNKCVFLERSGRRDTPVILIKPYRQQLTSLKHLCRRAINLNYPSTAALDTRLASTNEPLSVQLRQYLAEYPSCL